MKRRAFLTTAALAALAGCTTSSSTDDDPTTAPQQPTTEDPPTTPTETTTATTTAPQQATVEVSRSDYVLGESVTAPRDEQIPWAVLEIENTSPVPHGTLRAETRFYDSDDTILEVRDRFIHYLPPETTWRAYTRYYTETPDRVDHVTTRITSQTPDINPTPIESASIESTTLDATPEGGVDFAAEVDLGGATPERVTVLGLFYDDDGRFRGTIRGVETSPGSTVAVSGATIGIRTPPDRDGEQITSQEVFVFDGIM